MLQNNRENLELDRLHNETRKLIAERQKLLAELGRRIFIQSRWWPAC